MKPIRAVEDELRSNTAIDALVNNAGTAQMAPFLAGDVAHQPLTPQYHGADASDLCDPAAPRRRITTAAYQYRPVLSLHVRAGSALYSATKAWVLSFTRGLQEEFADSNLRIQAVLPAATATEIWQHSGVTGERSARRLGEMTTDDMVDASLAGLIRRADYHSANA